MNKQELADFLGTTLCMVETNFPKVKARALREGYLIIKHGKGATAVYDIEKTTPQNVSSKTFSTVRKEYWKEDLPNEIWITTYCSPNYEVSTYGRFRNKKDLSLNKGHITAQGYHTISLDDKTYSAHRVEMLSFCPIDNADEMTVDHIDGNRSNNKIENLQWVSNTENVSLMLMHRSELNKELTRLLQNYNYDELLQILKQLE